MVEDGGMRTLKEKLKVKRKIDAWKKCIDTKNDKDKMKYHEIRDKV